MSESISNTNQAEQLRENAVMRCCNLCANFRHEEVGDSDYGAVYAKDASCSEYYDTDEETEEDIPNFDRTIERKCGVLDFFKVCEIDKDLSDKLSDEMDKTEGSFSSTYKIFCERYNNA